MPIQIEKEAEELPHESIDNMCGSYPPPKQQQEPQQIPPDDRRPKAATKRSQNSFRNGLLGFHFGQM